MKGSVVIVGGTSLSHVATVRQARQRLARTSQQIFEIK